MYINGSTDLGAPAATPSPNSTRLRSVDWTVLPDACEMRDRDGDMGMGGLKSARSDFCAQFQIHHKNPESLSLRLHQEEKEMKEMLRAMMICSQQSVPTIALAT